MKKIIVRIIFNNAGFKTEECTREWIEYRMSIFMKYTCTSLINQTNQNFDVLISYRLDTEELVLEELSKYDRLPENILFTHDIEKSIEERIKEYDELYLVRLDSDDMYHPTFIQQIWDIQLDENIECIINQSGYIYDIENDKLGEWYRESPPFYVLVYKVVDYLNGSRFKLVNGHVGAIDLQHTVLELRNFMVIVHGKNTLTKFNLPLTKKVIYDDEKSKILNEFLIFKN